MKCFRFALNFLAVILFTLAFTHVADAQSRTWVSGSGMDTNPCTRIAPCKTFAAAVTLTPSGGEVNCVDAGEFGAVSITKPLTIDCGGTFGSISASTSAITINAGSSDVVAIRNLSITASANTPSPGIWYYAGGPVTIENVTVSNFGLECIRVTTGGAMSISNTTLSHCNTGIGISSPAQVLVDITNSRISRTSVAVNASNGSRLMIRDCTISQNTVGVEAFAEDSSPGSIVTVTGSTLAFSSQVALSSGTNAFILAFGNTFVHDVLVFGKFGGQIFTGSDNNNSANGGVGNTSGTVPKI